MQTLNPITMALKGNNLIEASAGTGKTYTITSLYLRALLGLQIHGEQNEGLSVEQILVVTFTEAATEEIRDRVRSKLIEAKEAIFYLDCETDNKPKADPLLLEIIEQLDDKQQAFERLDGAVKMMDEAAIFTIHGFCQRMLKYHAFESGSLFDNEFILDEQLYLLTAIKDFWRCTVYPLSGALLTMLLANWRSPEALLSEVKSLLNKQANRIEPQVSFEALEGNISEYQTLSSKVKASWMSEQVPALMTDSAIAKNRKQAKAEYLEAFTNFCQSDELEFKKGKDSWELWSLELVKKAYGKKALPDTTIFESFSRLVELKTLINEQVNAYFKTEALKVVQRNLADAKAKAQKLSPDDLLTKMAESLKGDGGQLLAQRIASQYPLAMIDEFQDTDPLQYAIFSRIYDGVDTTLVMIGVPKQAIYGFRGADIFTYIGAKEAVSEAGQYTLDRNWRSSAALIKAVNGLFTYKQSAFIYDDAIPFNSVLAADKVASSPLKVADDNGAALQFMQLKSVDGNPIAKGPAIGQLASGCADEIVNLLTKAQSKLAMIGNESLQAGDICILVRDRNEAQVMRDALTERGVSSVFLSRQSVFETQLANDFYILLQAIYQQNNDKAIRAALITCFFKTSINDLWHLTQNEDSWQQIITEFAELHRLWTRFGVMAILQHLLVEQDLASHWQQSEKFPERMLTDIRHLAELLQQKSMELDGVHRLLNWYQQQLLGVVTAGQDGQEKIQQLRLEDDSNLVQIVTMHASKGLEYPIVFMPFACHYRPTKSAIYHDDNKDLVIDFTNNEANLASADKERLAEDLRLLYVALTRAVYRCYVGISNLKHGAAKKSVLASTSLGYLLLEGDDFNDSTIETQLESLVNSLNGEGNNCAALIVVDSSEQPISTYQAVADTEQTYQLPQFNGVIEHDWKVTSYSALSRGIASVHVLPGTTDEGSADGEALPVVDTSLQPSLQEKWDRFSFPKGANAGSCLHQILENLPFIELAQGFVDEKGLLSVADSLAHYGIDPNWQGPVIEWLADVAATPWSKSGIALGQLRQNDCLIEMEFFLNMSYLKPGQINEVLSEHLGRKVNDFAFSPVQGVLKGFIDLTVCYKNKYYVVDYKSNYLGDNSVHYLGEALETAMDSHHYHLQYLLYTLALHRFLRRRIKNYDYDTHIGGSYYLFVRGMSSVNQDFNGVYFSKPKRKVIERLDKLFAGSQGDKEQNADNAQQAALEQVNPEQLGLFTEG